MEDKSLFNKIIHPENLFLAWDEFKKGKRSRPDVERFEFNLEENIFELHRELKDGIYKHGPYTGFQITDPKLRSIHKAEVRDRILHHAVFNILNPIFEPTFISTSFSCRIGKGTHKGVGTVKRMLQKVSRNNTKNCYALKCDVKKFFDSIDHQILFKIIGKKIKEKETLRLIRELVGSYWTELPREREREREIGASRQRNTNRKSHFSTFC